AGTPAPGSRPPRAPRGGAHGGGAGTGEDLSSRGAGVLPAERRWCARGARGTVPRAPRSVSPPKGPATRPALCLRPRRPSVFGPGDAPWSPRRHTGLPAPGSGRRAPASPTRTPTGCPFRGVHEVNSSRPQGDSLLHLLTAERPRSTLTTP